MKLDFRTKALMTIVISFVLLFGNLQKTYPWVAWCLMALPYMLLLSEKKFGKAFKGIAWLIVALILEKCAVYFSFSGLLASVALFFSIIVLPYATRHSHGRIQPFNNIYERFSGFFAKNEIA